MKTLRIGSVEFRYTVEDAPERATVGIYLEPEDRITVRCPDDVSESDVKEILHDKKSWLLEKRDEQQEVAAFPPEREFYSGEKFPYRGRWYRLKLHFGGREPALEFGDGKFFARVPDSFDEEQRKNGLRELFRDWYGERADAVLTETVESYSRKLGVDPGPVRVKDLTSRWGSVGKTGFSFNWRLVMAPIRIQDYVAVHELAHLREREHTESFWNTVGAVLPDYESRKEWLRRNWPILSI
ncbi:MAG: hypothetical protein MAG715_00485 [Methanonatronarchaeales archaeon]|nr:hypothetical protein [Methanonatronarchaeales archaeon]